MLTSHSRRQVMAGDHATHQRCRVLHRLTLLSLAPGVPVMLDVFCNEQSRTPASTLSEGRIFAAELKAHSFARVVVNAVAHLAAEVTLA